MMNTTNGFNDAINWFYILIHFVIAFVAGSIKEINKVASNRFSFRNLISGGAVSSFVGTLTYLVCDFAGLDGRLCIVFTGVGGWLGVNLMDFLGLALKKKIGKIIDVDVSAEEEKSHSELINK